MPGCNRHVTSHRTYIEEGGVLKKHYKNFCSHHRDGAGKTEANDFKVKSGCVDGSSCLHCQGQELEAHQYDIHHCDGDHHNNSPENIEVRCKPNHADWHRDNPGVGVRRPAEPSEFRNLFEEL